MMNKKFIVVSIFLIANCILLAQKPTYVKLGYASFYADKFNGRTTANGEKYYHKKLTAAHRTLPFGSIVKVTNLQNNKSVVVRVNDRGPFVDNRIIDLSKSAAKKLEFIQKGITKVRIEQIASIDDIQNSEANSNVEYFEIDAKRIYPKTYGIQIASFTENKNLLNFVDKLNSKYTEKVIVKSRKQGNKVIYNIIIGKFPDKKQAELLLKRIQKQFPDCFIIRF